jgi:hypothetical protein
MTLFYASLCVDFDVSFPVPAFMPDMFSSGSAAFVSCAVAGASTGTIESDPS